MDSSPFARLSAELRNRIYEFALKYEGRIAIHDAFNMRSWVCHSNPNVFNTIALTQTCRQIRSESLTMFCASNFFIAFYPPHYVIEPKAAERLLTLGEVIQSAGTHILGNLRKLEVHDGTSRHIMFEKSILEPGKVTVTCLDYTVPCDYDSCFESSFGLVVAAYEDLGLDLEEKSRGHGPFKKALDKLQAAEPHEIYTNGCQLRYGGRRYHGGTDNFLELVLDNFLELVLAPSSHRHARPEESFTEVSLDELRWFWKPFVKTCRAKGLRILEPGKEVPPSSQTTCGVDEWLILATRDYVSWKRSTRRRG